MTSKKSKQHNVFEAEEQIWRTELVKFMGRIPEASFTKPGLNLVLA